MSDDTTPPPPSEGAVPPPQPPVPPAQPPAPPAPGYGVPPAPPVPPAYSAPPTGAGGYDAVAAIKYGWATFTKNPGDLLVPALAILVPIFVVDAVLQLVLSGIFLDTTCTVRTDTIFGVDCDGPSFLTRLLVAAVVSGIGGFVSQVLVAGLIRSSLDVVDGRPALSVGEVFSWVGKPGVVPTAIILAALSAVGTLFFYLPGIIIGFLTAFTMYFVVDKGLSGVEAVKASVTFITGKLGDTIVFMLLGAVTIIVGVIACLIGVFVAIPVVLVAAAYTFRVLHDQPVAPIA